MEKQEKAQKVKNIYDSKKKSVIVAYGIWFFFGLIGLQSIYLNSVVGFIILLLLFISALAMPLMWIIVLPVWLISAVFIPFQVTNINKKIKNELSLQYDVDLNNSEPVESAKKKAR